MEFGIVNDLVKQYDVLVVPCFLDVKNDDFKNILSNLENKKLFSSKEGASYNFLDCGKNSLSNIIFLGLGFKKDITYEKLYKHIVSCFKDFKFNRNINILINLFESKKINYYNVLKAFVLSLNSCNYTFSKYFSKKRENFEINVDFYCKSSILDVNNLNEIVNIMDCINITRNLVNEPSNILTPHEFAQRCCDVVKKLDVDIDVYDENWIKENKLKALYEVGKASANKPRFIVMKYFGNKQSNRSISFVGKGLTYDSGGYSIKSSDGMLTMKCDMGGAASVLSLITLVAREMLKINIYVVIPVCENMIDGNGLKPGDVIGSLSNKTIEIISTDAEGRLVLADGVYYAADKLNSDVIIDIATLTGACGIALGTKYAAIIDNNEELFDQLYESTENTVDNIWRLPGDEEYKELLKSDIADLKNLGGRYGGTITAGLFVGEFVKGKPWAHIDIAYVSWNDTPSSIFPKKGGTGALIELLYKFCKMNSEK